jgi:hypothetical protein
MLKPLVSFVTGTLCTLGLWFCQEPDGEKRIVVGVVSSEDLDESRDPAQLIAEMQELRAQLVAVLGPLHPTTRMLDARILQMSQPRSIAEWVVESSASGSQIYEAATTSPWLSPAQAPTAGFTFAPQPGIPTMPFIPEGGAAQPLFDSHEGWPNHFVLSAKNLPSIYTDRLARVTAGPTSGLGQRIADLRQQWSNATDEAQKTALLSELRTAIAEQFDADLASRREQVSNLEAKLNELRKQIEKRESRRDEFVDVLTKHTEMEWEGISLRKNNATALPSELRYQPATTAPASTAPASTAPASIAPHPGVPAPSFRAPAAPAAPATGGPASGTPGGGLAPSSR